MTNLSSTKDGAIPSRSLALLQALCFLSLAQWDNLFPSPALTSTTPSLTGTSHLLPSFPDPKTQHHIRAPPCRLGACPAAAHYDTCPKHWHWAALFEMVSEGLKKKKKQLDVSKIYEEKVWEETCMPWSLCSWTSLSQAISYCFDYCPENASVMLFVQPAEQQYLSGDGIHWENAFLCAKGNKQKHVTRLTGMETSCRR